MLLCSSSQTTATVRVAHAAARVVSLAFVPESSRWMMAISGETSLPRASLALIRASARTSNLPRQVGTTVLRSGNHETPSQEASGLDRALVNLVLQRAGRAALNGSQMRRSREAPPRVQSQDVGQGPECAALLEAPGIGAENIRRAAHQNQFQFVGGGSSLARLGFLPPWMS